MSLNSNPDYKLEKTNLKRNKANQGSHIIINQSYDYLTNKTELSPELLYDDRIFRSYRFFKIAKEDYKYHSDFSHFYIENINNYYTRINSLALHSTSPFIEELIKEDYINPMYKDAIVITLFGNYSIEAGDVVIREQYDVLGYLIADLRYTFKIPSNKVIKIEDIFNFKKNDKNDLPYGIQKNRIDMSLLDLYIKKYYV